MTDTITTRLPDLIVRTTSRGERFAWRLVTLDDERFLTSVEQSDVDGSPADFETRAEARQAGGRMLLSLVEAQNAVEGEIVPMPVRAMTGPGRLAA
jgi:hypothetical protein